MRRGDESTQEDRRRNKIIYIIVLAKFRREMTKEPTERLAKVISEQPTGMRTQSVY